MDPNKCVDARAYLDEVAKFSPELQRELLAMLYGAIVMGRLSRQGEPGPAQ